MSSRHPDEQPETRDELDDVLDTLLTGARRDLHAAVERVLDVDRGRDAITGPHTTKTGTRPTAPAESRPPRSARSAYAEILGLTSAASPTSGTRAARDSVEGRIATLREMIASNPKTQSALHDLHQLQEGLAERRLSHAAAALLVAKIELSVKSAATKSQLNWLTSLTVLGLGFVVGAVLGNIWWAAIPAALTLIPVALSCGALVVYRMLTAELGLRRHIGGMSVLTAVQGLRQAIARLFDDSYDDSIQTKAR